LATRTQWIVKVYFIDVAREALVGQNVPKRNFQFCQTESHHGLNTESPPLLAGSDANLCQFGIVHMQGPFTKQFLVLKLHGHFRT
jgi:hypothetical protein